MIMVVLVECRVGVRVCSRVNLFLSPGNRATHHTRRPRHRSCATAPSCTRTCYNLVGYQTLRGASTFAVVLTAVMLAVSLIVTLVSARVKTMRLVSSMREPTRDGITLADGQQWHLFLSHVWSTGQVCHSLASPVFGET